MIEPLSVRKERYAWLHLSSWCISLIKTFSSEEIHIKHENHEDNPYMVNYSSVWGTLSFHVSSAES